MTGRQILYGGFAVALAACAGSSSSGSTQPDTTLVVATTATNMTVATTIPATTTTTLSEEELAAIQYDSDVKAIKTLWRRASDSWLSSGAPDSAWEYYGANNYPGEECSAEDLASNFDAPEGYFEENIVDAETIERDDGWTLPSGPNEGMVPDGRIYIYSLIVIYSAIDAIPDEQQAEAHATILEDGTAYFFISCGK